MSGDAPDHMMNSDVSMAEKAKFNAWKKQRGLTQEDAMTRYVEECNRQIRIYGDASKQQQDSHNYSQSKASSTSGKYTDGNGSLPRGIAAVPLLCAAATESLDAYKLRAGTANVSRNNTSWWRQQEPLCADPGTPLAFPEHVVLGTACKVEDWMCLNNSFFNSNNVLTAASYPVHNTLIAIWILFIYVCTFIGSTAVLVKTILLGHNRVGAGTIQDLFQQTIVPLGASTKSLVLPRQSLSVRTVGLLLLPLRYICQISTNVAGADANINEINSSTNSLVFGSIMYVWAGIMTWFYWLSILPWIAVSMLSTSFVVATCYAIIQFADGIA